LIFNITDEVFNDCYRISFYHTLEDTQLTFSLLDVAAMFQTLSLLSNNNEKDSSERKIFQSILNQSMNLEELAHKGGFSIAPYARSLRERKAGDLARKLAWKNYLHTSIVYDPWCTADFVIANINNLTVWHNDTANIITAVVMTVEVVSKGDSRPTVQSVLDGTNLPVYWQPVHALVLLADLFHDQLQFVKKKHIMQYNCHPQNILVGRDWYL
jgi:hypothetical protein